MAIADSVLNPPPARPEITRAVCRGASRHLRERGYAVVKEMTFANGRRGDIVALSPSGELLVVEVKSGIEDYRVDGKWPDYRDYCDRFFFAIPETVPESLIPEECGLIVADSFGAAILREPPDHPLSPARRKSVTLRFAHSAAGLLHALADPGAIREGAL